MVLDSAIQKFVNVDGDLGKSVMPFPHEPSLNVDAMELDKLSLRDRFNQIQHDLSPSEHTVLEGLLVSLCGAKPENAGFFDLLRLWALCSYSLDGLVRAVTAFRLRDGQSAFARQFFQEALDTQKLAYVFDCPITSVTDHGHEVEAKARSGQSFRGRRLICTIPHNVLGNIEFSPCLERPKVDAIRVGHVNQSTKVNAEVKSGELRSWEGVVYPHGRLIHGAGEGLTPSENTHVVCFGAAVNPLQPEKNIDDTLEAVKMFHDPMDVERLVFHNWNDDQYSNGGWSWLSPTVATRCLDPLRDSHGNVVFASADWALAWRGFIDGAIEEGTRAAMAVKLASGKQDQPN